MESPLAFELLTAEDDAAFGHLHRIYTEAIPERERKSEEKLREMARHVDYRFVLATLGIRIVGFSILFLPADQSFSLLEYIAVDAAYRNAGIGAGLLAHTMKITAGTPMLVEVDSDREECSDRGIRAGRIGFYRRHGCRRIEGLNYILPLPGEGDPPVMDLLVMDEMRSSVGDRTGIAITELKLWLRTIYSQVYGTPIDDPRIDLMLQTVEDPIRIV